MTAPGRLQPADQRGPIARHRSFGIARFGAYRDFRTGDPLLFGFENGNLEAVRLLLEHGTHVHNSSTSGYALAEAATRGRMDLVKLLLARGIRALARDAALRLAWTTELPAIALGRRS